jgi:transcriptional regulator with XRE-family HTH domain
VDPKERRAFEDLGRRVLELRTAHGWTQEEAAEKLSLDVRDLQRIEAGRVNLTFRSLLRVARGLGAPLRALFEPPRSREPRKPGRPRKA